MKKPKEYFDSSTSAEAKTRNVGEEGQMLKSWNTNNSLVSDNQQSCKKRIYSYRKLISYPSNESITENKEIIPHASFFSETDYDDDDITEAPSTDYDSDTFVRYKTINQKENMTKCFNNMLKDFLENDAGTGTLRKYAGVSKKDFDLDTFMRYDSSTLELKNLLLPRLVRYQTKTRSKEQREKYFPCTEGNSVKSLSFNYYGPGHTGIRNMDNFDETARTTLGKMTNYSKQNNEKSKVWKLKLENILHKKDENSVKEGILWQQTNNPFFR